MKVFLSKSFFFVYLFAHTLGAAQLQKGQNIKPLISDAMVEVAAPKATLYSSNHIFLKEAVRTYIDFFFQKTPGYRLGPIKQRESGVRIFTTIKTTKKQISFRIQIILGGKKARLISGKAPFRQLSTLQQRLFLLVQTRLARSLLARRVNLSDFRVEILNQYIGFQQSEAYGKYQQHINILIRDENLRRSKRSLAKLNLSLANISRFLGANETAHRFYLSAEKLHRISETQDKALEAFILVAQARYYFGKGQFLQARKLVTRVLENTRFLSNPSHSILSLLAEAAILARELDMAEIAHELLIVGTNHASRLDEKKPKFLITYFQLATSLSERKVLRFQPRLWHHLSSSAAESRFNNTWLHLAARLNLATSFLKLKNYEQATIELNRINRSCQLLGIQDKYLCIRALHSKAEIFKINQEKRKAKAYFSLARRRYVRLRKWPHARAAKRNQITLRIEKYNKSLLDVDRNSGLSKIEERVIAAYLGGYTYSRHSPAVRARTYDQRQNDTNILLKDLLNHTPSKSSVFNFLQRQVIDESIVGRKGKGVLFVDIGPAVANRYNPAVTSMNTAAKFPLMDVVALDLPNEVQRFKKFVPEKVKNKLVKQKRMFIFSGDGMVSLKKQFQKQKNWFFKKKGIPNWQKKKLIVIRAANSIDIYFKWKQLKPVLQQMSNDFEDQALLIFLNRAILYKTKNSREVKLIGRLSIRGFHHNRLSFDRKGEEPYALLPIY